MVMHCFRRPNLPTVIGTLVMVSLCAGVAHWRRASAQVAGFSQVGVASLTLTSLGSASATPAAPATQLNDSGYQPGQSLQWTGTFQQMEFSSLAAQSHELSFGADPAQPSQAAYEKGSAFAPPGYEIEWRLPGKSGTSSSWTSDEPGAAALISGVRFNYRPVIAAPVSKTSALRAQGDGYRAIPYTLPIKGVPTRAIFTINHHSMAAYLKCFVANTGLPCPGWPSFSQPGFSTVYGADVPSKAGQPLANLQTFYKQELLHTPVKVTERLDRKTGRLYFPVMSQAVAPGTVPGPTFDTRQFESGVVCADLIHMQSCGFTPTGLAGRASGSSFPGMAGLGNTEDGRMYLLVDPRGSSTARQQIQCFDSVAGQPCPGQPYFFDATTGSSLGGADQSTAFLVDEKIFIGYGNGLVRISCFDTRQAAACATFKPVVTPQTSPGIHPRLDASGRLIGVCLVGSSRCFDMTGSETAVPADSALAKFLAYVPFFSGRALQSYVTHKTRVYNFASERPSGQPLPPVGAISCFDFAKNDFCFDNADPRRDIFPASGKVSLVTDPEYYAVTEDPERAGCVWALGDENIAAVWDGTTGGDCVETTVSYQVDTEPVKSYGFDGTLQGEVDYKRVLVTGLADTDIDDSPGRGVRATVDALNADGTPGERLVDDTPLARTAGNPDFVLDLASVKTRDGIALDYRHFPRLRTQVTIHRNRALPDWPAQVRADLIWSGPPLQFGVRTRAPANATGSCLAASYVQSGVFTARTSLRGVESTTVGRSNALVENLKASASGTVAIESASLGFRRATPRPREGAPTVAIFPFYDNDQFRGDLAFFDVTTGTDGAAVPTAQPLASVHELTGLTSAQRRAYTANSDGQTVELQWTQLDDDWRDALDRDRGLVRDGLGADRVDYLRGDRSKEAGRSGSPGIFHARNDRGPRCLVDCKFESKGTDLPDPGAMTSTGVALLLPGVLSGYSEALAPGYARFQAQSRDAATGRPRPVVFASSNDGFLYAHSIDAATPGALGLKEEFTFLPRRLQTLMSGYTDRNLRQLGVFPALNDGAPLLADFCAGECADAARARWRTALVSSFGRGFSGGYAIDVTDVGSSDPKKPPVVALWEFSDRTPDDPKAVDARPSPARYLGRQSAFPLSAFSNAALSSQVVRVKIDGKPRWAWIIGNGANSQAALSAGVDGNRESAVLYLVFMDGAANGLPEYVGLKLAGAAGMPNGLSTPNPVDADGDGVVDLVYAGDLQGHLWRVDLQGLTLAGGLPATAATVLINATNADGVVQPIVGAPAVVRVGNDLRMVVFESGRPEVGSSRYLDNGAQRFSLFGVRDESAVGQAGTGASPPSRTSCAQRTLAAPMQVEAKIRTGETASFSLSARTRDIQGDAMKQEPCWALDLPAGESGIGNAVFNPVGTAVELLSIESPSAVGACSAGGSWINRLNALTGLSVGIDLNADGLVSSTERAYGGISIGRSTGLVINNGRSLSTGNSNNPLNGQAGAGVLGPNTGRIWWREL